jgi:cytochrome c peroxidase
MSRAPAPPRAPLLVLVAVVGGCATQAGSPSSVPVEAGPAASAAASPSIGDLRRLYARPPAEWPAPVLDAGVEHRELGLVVRPPAEEDPRLAARVELGELLYFDGRLSGTGQMSCASCHDAELGFADGRSTSLGKDAKPLKRNAPALLNTGLRKSWFWDGRAASLEEQALAVMSNPAEMDADFARVAAFLSGSRGYSERFEAAFGPGPIGMEQVAASIAAYERTFVSDGSSAFDDFLEGDHEALSDAELRGLHLFRTKARCLNCHNGPLFTDEQFHNAGLTYFGRELQDLGRYEQTKDPADVGRFRTPSLRNLGRTAPYMHNGQFDLDGVLNMYNAGMPRPPRRADQKDDPLFPAKSPLLRQLGLEDEEKADLKAFLLSLTERRRRIKPPALPAAGDS